MAMAALRAWCDGGLLSCMSAGGAGAGAGAMAAGGDVAAGGGDDGGGEGDGDAAAARACGGMVRVCGNAMLEAARKRPFFEEDSMVLLAQVRGGERGGRGGAGGQAA